MRIEDAHEDLVGSSSIANPAKSSQCMPARETIASYIEYNVCQPGTLLKGRVTSMLLKP